MYDIQLKLSIHKAFLGHIEKNVRAIAYNYTSTCISIYAYFDTEPTDDNYEIINCAVTEILADFPQFLSQEIILTQTTAPISSLNAYKGWVFIRFEG